MANKGARQKAERFGRHAEFWAKTYLRLKGFQILEQRFKSKFGEVDIIAKRGNLLIFVEVKARQTKLALNDAFSVINQDRIGKAAQHWLAMYPQFYERTIRFDVIGLEPLRWPVHITDAFQLD